VVTLPSTAEAVPAARRRVGALATCFTENNLLTAASAIAFQRLVALVPLTFLALVLMGAFSVEEIWRDNVAPFVRERFTITSSVAVNRAVERMMAEYALFWIVIAVSLTLWQVSGSVRAAMGALNRIYGVEEERSFVHRFALSFALAAGVAACVLGALFAATLGGRVIPGPVPTVLVSLATWGLALVLLWLVIAMMIRFGPVRGGEIGLVSVGSLLVIAGWLAATFAYGLYVRYVVDFESAFGIASAIFLLTGYLYYSSIIFLTGAQIDQLRRDGGRIAQDA
jgi:membrane protein